MILHHFCRRSLKITLFYLMRGNGTLLDRCHVAPQRNTCFLVLERCWSRNKLKMIVSYSHMTVVRLQAEGWTHKGEYAETCVFSEILVHLRYPLQNNCVFSEILEILEISGSLVMDILNGFKSLKFLKSQKKHRDFRDFRDLKPLSTSITNGPEISKISKISEKTQLF